MRRTPPIVRGSILAALDAIDAADTSSASGRDRAAGADRGGRFSIRRARIWAPAAIAAVAVFAFVILHGVGGTPPAHAIPPFDVAIEHYQQFAQRFEPNVKSALPADLSDAYMDHQLPGFLWNFQHSGYKLIGGRIDRLADGSSVAYTFYRGDNGAILCTYMKSHGMQPPGGETQEIRRPSLLPVQGLQRLPELPARRLHLRAGFAPPDERVHAGHRRFRALAFQLQARPFFNPVPLSAREGVRG